MFRSNFFRVCFAWLKGKFSFGSIESSHLTHICLKTQIFEPKLLLCINLNDDSEAKKKQIKTCSFRSFSCSLRPKIQICKSKAKRTSDQERTIKLYIRINCSESLHVFSFSSARTHIVWRSGGYIVRMEKQIFANVVWMCGLLTSNGYMIGKKRIYSFIYYCKQQTLERQKRKSYTYICDRFFSVPQNNKIQLSMEIFRLGAEKNHLYICTK